MKISIVIICWNDLKVLPQCLSSIYERTQSTSFEVIVSDNGLTDGSIEFVRHNYPQNRIIENGANLGYARDNNSGIRVAVSDSRNEIFNVGADVPFTVNELARVVADAMGLPCNVRHLEPRNEVKVAFSDHNKCERIFGGREKTPLADGTRMMASWVKEHGARESSIFKNIEIPKNLPPSWAEAVAEVSNAP